MALVAALAAALVPGSPPGAWERLRERPLVLPFVAAGTACPVSRVDPRVDFGRWEVGDGIGRRACVSDAAPRARERASFTRVRAPGCYAYQIDGLGFSRRIVFRSARFRSRQKTRQRSRARKKP
jgi:hypothetical protein